MKFTLTMALLLTFSFSFCQWTRVQQLPSNDIFTIYRNGSTLYAGGKNLVYFSHDKGLTWDSTTTIPQFFEVDNIIVYKNELYASCYSKGVVKSSDEGITWKNLNAGIFPFVSDFCEWTGDLYAATLGNAAYKLDPVNRDNWILFNTGLSTLSLNQNAIAGNSQALIAGTNNNGLYDLRFANSASWDELFLLGQINPTEGTYDIITAHDSLFLSGHSGSFYKSVDNGVNWNKFGNKISSVATTLLNARQALIVSEVNFNGTNNTSFFYIKKDSLQGSFIPFSSVIDHFTYKLEISGNKLWDASSKGLFFMSLSQLPGISGADDTIVATPLPVRFSSFNTNCEKNKIVLNWTTAQEQQSSHFDIEESPDSNNWSVIGSQSAAGNSNVEINYSFTKNNPSLNQFYRIVEYDIDGRANYSGIVRSLCINHDEFKLSPNPAHDKIFINLSTGYSSRVTLEIFDSKGSLVKKQNVTILQGNNRISVDLTSLASGVYQIRANWNNGQNETLTRFMKL